MLSKAYKNVIVMVFDGMGTSILEKSLDEDSFLRKHFVRSISSVFPPTTTAATITMESGLSPIEHAWLGWSLYFKELAENVNIFPNTISGSKGAQAANYNVAQRYIPYKDIYQKIDEATKGSVLAKRISPFSEYESQSLKEIYHTITDLCSVDVDSYIYTYWHQPDYDMHNHGTDHLKIKKHIIEINNMVDLLSKSLTDTLIIVTADHGLIDTDWLFITDYPELDKCLLRRPSIESRAMNFFIRPDKFKTFESLFKKYFKAYYDLYTREEVIAKGFFGPGVASKRSLDFMGDYLAVAKSNISIEYSIADGRKPFKAAHAGISKEEFTVPFIVVECA